MKKIKACLLLRAADRFELERLIDDGNTAQKLVTRAKIVLATARGLGTNAIMRDASTSKPTVWRWQAAYIEGGVPRLLRDKDKGAKSGRTPIGAQKTLEILTKTVKEKPAGATHWSVRSMAGAVGVSHTTVQRIWKAADLKPHVTRTFKVSNDPKFAEKVVDIVGLYLNPPENAVVLSVDEKSQIQALDRTQPGLPLKKGRAGTMTHDYKRNGVITYFAAYCTRTGHVIGECLPRHRAKEFIKFLKTIDRSVEKHLAVHLVLDNYATHKTPAVKAWLAKHKRFKMHFTPTSASWLNMVERLFAELTRQCVRRGVFKSVAELVAAIEAWTVEHNRNPIPFKWKAKAATILAKDARARQALAEIKAAGTL